MAHVLVFKSQAKKQVWMTGSKNWQDFNKVEAIEEYRRFTSEKAEQRTLLVEVNHLAKQSDLVVEFVDVTDGSAIDYKKVLKGEYEAIGYTVLGRP